LVVLSLRLVWLRPQAVLSLDASLFGLELSRGKLSRVSR